LSESVELSESELELVLVLEELDDEVSFFFFDLWPRFDPDAIMLISSSYLFFFFALSFFFLAFFLSELDFHLGTTSGETGAAERPLEGPAGAGITKLLGATTVE
jgi:hypothetical protein